MGRFKKKLLVLDSTGKTKDAILLTSIELSEPKNLCTSLNMHAYKGSQVTYKNMSD